MKRNETFIGKIKPTLGISRCFPFRRRTFFFPESEDSGIPEMEPSMPCTANSSITNKKINTLTNYNIWNSIRNLSIGIVLLNLKKKCKLNMDDQILANLSSKNSGHVSKRGLVPTTTFLSQVHYHLEKVGLQGIQILP